MTHPACFLGAVTGGSQLIPPLWPPLFRRDFFLGLHLPPSPPILHMRTPQEMQSIEKAMKDPKFCKLFAEYAEEIANPKNRQVAIPTAVLPACPSNPQPARVDRWRVDAAIPLR